MEDSSSSDEGDAPVAAAPAPPPEQPPAAPAAAPQTSPPLPSPRSMPANALRRLLFGAPFAERVDGIDPSVKQLDCLLVELIELLRIEHGPSVAFGQAERELTDIMKMSITDDKAVACKRAMLLFALWRDPEIAARFRQSDAALLEHLQTNVLPVVGPRYLAELGQRPDSFVHLCGVLSALWPMQPLCLPLEAGGVGGGVGSV